MKKSFTNLTKFILRSLKRGKKPILISFLISLVFWLVVMWFVISGALSFNRQQEYCVYTAESWSHIQKDSEKSYVLTWKGFAEYDEKIHKGKNVYVEIAGMDIHESNYFTAGNFCKLTNMALKNIGIGIAVSIFYSFLLAIVVSTFVLFLNYCREKYEEPFLNNLKK